MFLRLGHHEMHVYPCTLRLARETYRFIATLPLEERYAMAFQLRKSSTSVVLNLAEGAARKSLADRTHFYRMARASVVEIDATLDTANELGYIKDFDLAPLGEAIVSSFRMLTGMIDP